MVKKRYSHIVFLPTPKYRVSNIVIKEFYTQRIRRRLTRHLNNLQIWKMGRRVARHLPPTKGAPVIFFKASSGIDDFSWNAAFHLLSSWAFRLQGIPVRFFACNAGMTHCVLGTNREHVAQKPPCKSCVYQSKTLYTGADANWFSFNGDEELDRALVNLSLADLQQFNFNGIPLGELSLPGLRWILRRHHLVDDEKTRYLLREYIRSAWNIAQKFELMIKGEKPRAVVVFNGQMY
ncbi:MAG TPA: hypothetical protein EYP74_05425, partial [Anaerolineales bacterium]|nr:hypothetical protein [Anaerolineales bacterium]